jgi:hypothetical protein
MSDPVEFLDDGPPVGDDRAAAPATIPVTVVREWAATATPFGGDAPLDYEEGYAACIADLLEMLDERERGDVEAALLAAAAEANERIATCHERVACPKCAAPIGERCRRMPRGYSPAYARLGRPQPSTTVAPHQERWTLVQAAR